MTSNSYHIIHVDFILFRFHITISLCHVFYKFQFLSSTCMTYHIIFKRIYTYTMANRTISNHIRCIQGQIRRIPIHNRLMLLSRPKPLIKSLVPITFHDLGCPFKTFCFVKLNFHFQKCRDPNPRLDPVGGSKLEPVYSDVFNQNIYFVLLNFSFQKCRDPNPRLDPVGGSKLEPDLLRHFQLSFQNICLCYSILDFLMSRKHFFSGNPINTYNFKRPLTFTFNKMHLQNNAFLQHQCNVKILIQTQFSIPSFGFLICDFTYDYRIDIHDRFSC